MKSVPYYYKRRQSLTQKFENFKLEKSNEVDELTISHENLKTKSKKLLYSQKQLLTENKSLKNQLGLISQSESSIKSTLSGEKTKLTNQINEANAKIIQMDNSLKQSSKFLVKINFLLK